MYGMSRADSWGRAVTDTVEQTIAVDAHETDVLDPRTDAPAGKEPVTMAPVDLGPIHVPTPVVLSPMAGVTNWPFRVLCEEYGPDGLYVAEMITARALVARNPKALRLCRFAPSERIRSLQLYGVNPAIVEQAARIVVDEDMADHVDLNFGCPVPKVTRRGGGSALPWKTDLFREIIQRVVKVCSAANIPVTAKIRVGIDHSHETFMEAGHIAQEEGCAAVTLHARTTAEYYGGHSDWSRIGELVGALDIPVFGNGDIWGADDALEMVRETGCAGVAIGRGCQGRPWLFADIRNAFAGSDERVNPTLGAVCDVIMRHARLLVEFYDGDERMAVHGHAQAHRLVSQGIPRRRDDAQGVHGVREPRRRGARDLASRSRHHLPRTGEGQAARPCSFCKKSASAVRLARLSGHHARGARDAVRRRSDGRRILRRHPGHGPNAAMVCRFVQMRWKNVDTRRENSFIINGSAIELCVTVSDRRQW